MFAAWVLIGLLSTAPAIVADLIGGGVPPWLLPSQVALGAAASAVAVAVPSWRPIARPALVLTALVGVPIIVATLDLAMPGLQRLLGGGPFAALMQPVQTAKLVVAAAIVGVLIALGLRPRDFFLRAGELTASIRPAPLLGFPKPASWRRVGLIWGFGIAAALAVAQYLLLRPSMAELGLLAAAMPSIVLFAALNSFTEEVTYRAPVIATVEPVAGRGVALWGSAVSFGIAHYFGIPGGVVGAVLAIFMGWILSKAMIETRGLFWPWFIHLLSDLAIFSSLAIAVTRA